MFHISEYNELIEQAANLLKFAQDIKENPEETFELLKTRVEKASKTLAFSSFKENYEGHTTAEAMTIHLVKPLISHKLRPIFQLHCSSLSSGIAVKISKFISYASVFLQVNALLQEANMMQRWHDEPLERARARAHEIAAIIERDQIKPASEKDSYFSMPASFGKKLILYKPNGDEVEFTVPALSSHQETESMHFYAGYLKEMGMPAVKRGYKKIPDELYKQLKDLSALAERKIALLSFQLFSSLAATCSRAKL